MDSVSVSLSYSDLRFHVVNGIRVCNLQSNGLSGKSFDEDLHLETWERRSKAATEGTMDFSDGFEYMESLIERSWREIMADVETSSGEMKGGLD